MPILDGIVKFPHELQFRRNAELDEPKGRIKSELHGRGESNSCASREAVNEIFEQSVSEFTQICRLLKQMKLRHSRYNH